jgi:hypothetical protein
MSDITIMVRYRVLLLSCCPTVAAGAFVNFFFHAECYISTAVASASCQNAVQHTSANQYSCHYYRVVCAKEELLCFAIRCTAASTFTLTQPVCEEPLLKLPVSALCCRALQIIEVLFDGTSALALGQLHAFCERFELKQCFCISAQNPRQHCA